MLLTSLEITGFKSFAKKGMLRFAAPIVAIVGPNGSGKSNVAEAFRFVLGEQSMKSMRGSKGEDLIWNGSPALPRGNRASVKVTFDNRNRFLKTDFDEITVERVVHRDGVNQYLVNGSVVRLKDVVEILAGGNIGQSGHHIISQGEADRILSASSRERREMVEDALGLKVFQYKREEAERKLEKTRENIAQVGSLRREIAPHLAFLKRQAEKVEKVAKLRDELAALYREYLAREAAYLSRERERLMRERSTPEARLAEIDRALAAAKAAVERAEAEDGKKRDILALERSLAEARGKREEKEREASRVEGQLEYAKRGAERGATGASVPLADVESLAEEVAAAAENPGTDAVSLSAALSAIVATVRGFVAKKRAAANTHGADDLEKLAAARGRALAEANVAAGEEQELLRTYETLKAEAERSRGEGRSAERDMFRLMAEQSEARAALSAATAAGAALGRAEEDFKRELAEGAALIGRAVTEYEKHPIDEVAEERSAQEARRRALEKVKIRIEESGGGSADEIMREYKEVQERDEFLEREVGDLERSASSLEDLIADLVRELDTQFRDGVRRINTEFQRFFALMFGGGTASLALVREKRRGRGAEEDEEDDEVEEGVGISVALPSKRVRGLDMLSGGERALTSIALIFAMSQVNPPPFIILDETDAALDEANSKRYGDMIESLAAKSQLILITHNRETMSRAGILYGVTMGGDGASKLLSVRFDEAVQVAK